MSLIRIQKLEELPDATHPKNIEVGHTAVGKMIAYPQIGQRFVVGSFVTSIVTKIIDFDTFATLNSIYRITPIRSTQIE